MFESKKLEEKIQYKFKKSKILKEALTHRSFLNENKKEVKKHNERLEFLGDAVLELAITKALFKKFPTEPEGVLTSYRSALVNTDTLAEAARRLEIDNFLLMSKGERMDTHKGRHHILANSFEALSGAIYLDSGFPAAEKFILENVFSMMDEIIAEKLFQDAKSHFQEKAQEVLKITPKYKTVEEKGPAHDRKFIVAVFLENKEVARGEGFSKQKAEIQAAKVALEVKNWE